LFQTLFLGWAKQRTIGYSEVIMIKFIINIILVELILNTSDNNQYHIHSKKVGRKTSRANSILLQNS